MHSYTKYLRDDPKSSNLSERFRRRSVCTRRRMRSHVSCTDTEEGRVSDESAVLHSTAARTSTNLLHCGRTQSIEQLHDLCLQRRAE
jgi:hypothetical protein